MFYVLNDHRLVLNVCLIVMNHSEVKMYFSFSACPIKIILLKRSPWDVGSDNKILSPDSLTFNEQSNSIKKEIMGRLNHIYV